MKFIPLHVYSEYSFLKSGLTLDKYFSFAKKNNLQYMGISDFEVMFGFPIFYEKCQELNIKPILGMDIKLGRFLLTLFIKDEVGYLNAIKISNTIQDNNFTYDQIVKNQEGLIFVLSVNINNYKDSLKSIQKLKEDLNDFYVGLETYNLIDSNEVYSFINETYSKIIIYPFVRYLKKDDAIVLDIVDAIKNSATLDYETKDGNNYLYTQKEIEEFYKDLPLVDIDELINKCNFVLEKNRGLTLKLFADNEAKKVIKERCLEGLKNKNKLNDTYLTRLNYELGIIDKMGFNNYFLVVSDYVNYAKTHDILVYNMEEEWTR